MTRTISDIIVGIFVLRRGKEWDCIARNGGAESNASDGGGVTIIGSLHVNEERCSRFVLACARRVMIAEGLGQKFDYIQGGHRPATEFLGRKVSRQPV